MASETEEERKPVVDPPVKSSMEILSELFSSFDAEPPVIVKKEKKDPTIKKLKKSKKKHKHKEKKHKKKDKKKKRDGSKSDLDLAKLLIKQEKETTESKIKIEGTDLSFKINFNNIETESDGQNDKGKVEDDYNNKETVLESITTKKSENKIDIKLNFNSIIETVEKNKKSNKTVEDGELSNSDSSSTSGDNKKQHKRKHKEDHDSSKSKKRRHRSRSKEINDNKLKSDDLRNKIKGDNYNISKEKSKEGKYKDNDFYKRSKDKDDYKSSKDREKDYRSRDKDKYRDYSDRNKRSRERDDDFYKTKDYDSDREERWLTRERYRGYNIKDREKRHRDRSGSRENSSYIDKKKLLEIARKNAIQMMKSGNLPGALTLGPQAQEKVIAAIKAGGKTIEELTDFCKTLSKKEELGDLSSASDENGSDSDTDKPFHHPFQIKDRPTSITMNIKNSVPLPIKSTQERSTELRMQFPVSSGQQHRKTESEWVPVPPKKVEPVAKNTTQIVPIAAIEAPPQPSPTTVAAVESAVAVISSTSGAQAFPPASALNNNSAIDIGSIVSQRLTAMRKLQENPNDVQALSEIYKSNKEMQSWAQSKQQPGQFTGTTGAQILSQAELSSGYQAWAKKDQLQCATPVSGGMGMHLLQKMGWKPGEGLGKEKTGALEPLLLEVKLDKKGLVANEEQKRKKQKQAQGQCWNVKSLQGKHPVSLLGEYSSKKKLGAPQYTLCFECGPDHKKNFLFKVILNGIEYKPNVASPNKKEAKAAAATICLQHIGLLP